MPAAQTHTADLPHDGRRHRRVDVRLPAAVVVNRANAYIARTANISESGVLLSDYRGPELARGRLVGLSLAGVLSDAGDGEQHYMARIVRYCGDTLALRFAEPQA